MAQLYDPEKMPAGLRKAQQELDQAVEAIYRLGNPFKSDTERLEFLFKMYEKMVNDQLSMVNWKSLCEKEKKRKKKG